MKRVRRLASRIPRPKCIAPGGSEAAESSSKSQDSKKDKNASFTELPVAKTPGTDADNKYKCGLNVRQAFLLKQNWKGVMREEDFFIELHLRLFKTNEGLQAMFQSFKHIQSDDELRSNEALEYHATMVMNTLDDAITHIDNYDFVHKLLCETGASHKRFEDFEPTTFLNIKQPFLDAVKVTLGDRYTENMENIYTIAINFLVDTMVEGLKVQLTSSEPTPIAPILRKQEKQAQSQ